VGSFTRAAGRRRHVGEVHSGSLGLCQIFYTIYQAYSQSFAKLDDLAALLLKLFVKANNEVVLLLNLRALRPVNDPRPREGPQEQEANRANGEIIRVMKSSAIVQPSVMVIRISLGLAAAA
jgi:hypothetical protein